MELIIPEDGWDEREVSYYCKFCDRTLIAYSVYLNMDWLIQEGLTQAEFYLELHLNDHDDLDYDHDKQEWHVI